MRDPDVTVYCDGSADKDGNAGWSAIYIGRNGKVRETFDWDPQQDYTSQQAELQAAIQAFRFLTRDGVKVRLITDSNYIVRCFNEGWLATWRAKNWRHKGKERPNRALWETLESFVELHKVEFVHVHGHTGVEMNERCDVLANFARRKCERERMERQLRADALVARENRPQPKSSTRRGTRATQRKRETFARRTMNRATEMTRERGS